MKTALYSCFFSGGDWDQMYGCYAPKDAVPEQIIAALLWHVEMLELSQLSAEELLKLSLGLMFIPLRSVVQADRDQLGDDCDWHTEASGKRSKDCWWIESNVINDVIDDVLARLKNGAEREA